MTVDPAGESRSRTVAGVSALPAPMASGKVREWWAHGADALVAAAAICLPWSTAATEVMTVAWLLVTLPLIRRTDFRQALLTGFGGIPVLLWCFAALGMLWGEAGWHERFAGIAVFHRLLCIPILVAQFRMSSRGWRIVILFLISCTVLLIASWVLFFFPSIPWRGSPRLAGSPIPVKDYIVQSELFVLSAFGLLAVAAELWRSHRFRLAVVLVLFAGVFVANVAFVIAGRSAFATIPVLLLVLGLRYVGWKGGVVGSLTAVLLAGVLWVSSPYVRHRVIQSIDEVEAFQKTEQLSSSGTRLEFWKKSIGLVSQAPLFGYGTGEVRHVFQESAQGKTGAAAIVTNNPHNQVLAVALQLGIVGVGLLLAMWRAHLLFFMNQGLACSLGLVVVVQNVVGSLFNSHLFDFTQGWLYVFAVGLLGGMALRSADSDLVRKSSARPPAAR